MSARAMLLTESRKGGSYSPRPVVAGAAYGDLTPVRIIGTHPRYGSVWLCECSCGEGTTRRTAAQLNFNERRSRRSCCARCRDRRWLAKRAARRHWVQIAHFRQQWALEHSLWGAGDEELISRVVEEDLVVEFGFTREEFKVAGFRLVEAAR